MMDEGALMEIEAPAPVPPPALLGCPVACGPTRSPSAERPMLVAMEVVRFAPDDDNWDSDEEGGETRSVRPHRHPDVPAGGRAGCADGC